jgi:nitrite reductase/ring-hydroxylating ferredoxin subunit
VSSEVATPQVRRYVVAPVADLPDGERLVVEVGGREIGIFNQGGRYHAFLNRCPHLGGPLCRGQVIGLIESDGPGDVRLDPDRAMLVCPWHGWEFDMETGRSFWDPRRTQARRYPVQVQEGESIGAERVPGPYVAETVAVSVQDSYLVVTMRASTGGAGGRPATGIGRELARERMRSEPPPPSLDG